ncbi:MAG: threonine/serine exporter family protein, partial [Sandaracinaceae bacterium]|nr:threonine/serine exporter family protein [Sandaracinaceae bacterium]
LGRILPALAAVTSTLLARGATLAGLAVHESILVLASVIVVLPGFTLTTATTELATANIVSGTSRLMGAMTTLLQLGFGVALAHRIAILFPGPEVPAPVEQPLWWGLAASVFAALAFAVLLRAAPRDVPVILLGAAVAVAGARLGRVWLGPELGAFVGSFLLGVAAHLHARFRDRPVLLVLAPGSLLMVPGSLGFLSVASMLDADVVPALQTGFRMLLIAMSLAAGILLATVAIPPRRAL